MKSTTCLFIGNIPYHFTTQSVTDLFRKFGAIKDIAVPIDKATNRNKGFTFVTFENRADAEDAMDYCRNAVVEGRKLRCDWDVGSEKKEAVREVNRPPRREFSPPPSLHPSNAGGPPSSYGGPPPPGYGYRTSPGPYGHH